MAAEDKCMTMKDKMNLQRKELATKQRTLNTFNLVEGKPFEGKKVYECPKCKGKCFTSKSYLRAHCKRRHPEGIEEAPTLQKVQPGLLAESRPAPAYNEQAEELKAMQTKLKTLISQAISSMNGAENQRDSLAKEYEISSLRQTLSDLNDKYRQLEDQLYNLQRTQKLEENRLGQMKITRPQEPLKSHAMEQVESHVSPRYSAKKKPPREPREAYSSKREEPKILSPVDERRMVRSAISSRMSRSSDYKGERNLHTMSL